MISVICAYNNRTLLENYLLKSLRNQTAKYELILIDNTKNRFKSSAKVFNAATAQATGEYLMCVHQDIYLLSDTFLEKTEKVLTNLPRLGIAGVAGNSVEGFFSNIRTSAPIKVQTLDSVLAIIPRPVFDLVQFDEKTIRGWYFYITDYCLTTQLLGYDTYVIPADFHHTTSGSVSLKYFIGLPRLLLKHRQQKIICTGVADWSLNARCLMEVLVRAPRFVLSKLKHPKR